MEDRSKRTETVRPQFGECCECQSDGVLGVKSDGNDIELNGETDDEDGEDGEMGFDDGSAQERNIRDSGQTTAHEHQEHMIMLQVLRDGTRRELAAQEIGRSIRFGWSSARVNGLWFSWREGL